MAAAGLAFVVDMFVLRPAGAESGSLWHSHAYFAYPTLVLFGRSNQCVVLTYCQRFALTPLLEVSPAIMQGSA
jgi:hypothetical protein